MTRPTIMRRRTAALGARAALAPARARLVSALAACLLLLAGCGGQSSEPDRPETSQQPPADQPTAPGNGSDEDDGPAAVTSISMTRSGGIAGVNDTWRLAPGDEHSDLAFELASRRAELEEEAATLDNEPVCCDFFVYQITVRYEDGGSVRAMLDDDPEAKLLEDLVTAVADSERSEPDETLR